MIHGLVAQNHIIIFSHHQIITLYRLKLAYYTVTHCTHWTSVVFFHTALKEHRVLQKNE